MLKWVLAVLALFAALAAALVVFTITDVIHPQTWVLSYAEDHPRWSAYLRTYERGQDVEAAMEAKEQKLAAAWDDLETVREELDQQQRELDHRSAALDSREQELENRRQEIEHLRAEVKGLQAEEENISRLADMYSEMRPTEAAAIFERLDLDVALNILRAMNARSSSAIMAELDPDLAAQLSRQLTEGRQ